MLVILFLVEVNIESQALALRAHRYHRNGRDLVPPVAVVDKRRLAAWSPGAADIGNQQKAAFIQKNQVRLQAPGFFLRAGQRRCFHSSMAASSRSTARRSGFRQDNCRRASNRPTWAR